MVCESGHKRHVRKPTTKIRWKRTLYAEIGLQPAAVEKSFIDSSKPLNFLAIVLNEQGVIYPNTRIGYQDFIEPIEERHATLGTQWLDDMVCTRFVGIPAELCLGPANNEGQRLLCSLPLELSSVYHGD